MAAISEIEPAMPESSESFDLNRADDSDRRFTNLRSIRWRVNLGVLPSFASSIDDFRRAAANCRRRYAALRRRLLIDPHVLKDESCSPDLVFDDPLSLNPDSTWGQFFRYAELEKTLDGDLSRLYPEHWWYFQAPGRQGMLRRILLLWCLKHPEYGYKQGMHELLAPLLYVLHVDVKHLFEVRKTYEDLFTDRFDSLSFEERDATYTFDINKFLDSIDDEIDSHRSAKKIKSLDELDPEVQSIAMLSDSYGAEGELGIVLSEKFMEHDAYCMFDALMGGNNGCVTMAAFFDHTPANGSQTGLSPVREACAAFYHLLSVVDPSLHSHLVELGVEPQYFGLRWLRVLFGREFSLQNLLIVWDEIFSADNSPRMGANDEDDSDHSFKSPRGTLILGMVVSMILYLRSSLLSTENTTCCLQKLLNWPENVDLNKIIEKAKSLQALALDTDVRPAPSINDVLEPSSPVPTRTKSFSSDSTSPKSPLIIAPESYWEEKWRVLQKAEEEQLEKPKLEKTRWSKLIELFRAAPDSKTGNEKRENNSLEVTTSLFQDLSQQLSSEAEETDKEDNLPLEIEDFHSAGEECTISEENSSVFSDPTNPVRDSNYIENESGSNTDSNLFHEDDKSQRTSSVVDSPSTESVSASSVSSCIGNDSNSNTESYLSVEDDTIQRTSSVDSPSSELVPASSVSSCIENDSDSKTEPNSFYEDDKIQRKSSVDSPSTESVPASSVSSCIENESDSNPESNLFDENDKRQRTSSVDSPNTESVPASSVSSCIRNDSDCSTEPSLLSDENNKVQQIDSSPLVPSQSGNKDTITQSAAISNERQFLPAVFQWFWKFKRNLVGVETSQSSHGEASSYGDKRESDQNLMKTLKNLGQSMLEHVQALESSFQQERGLVQSGLIENLSKTNFLEKGQITGTTALTELRKISNLLSEM